MGVVMTELERSVLDRSGWRCEDVGRPSTRGRDHEGRCEVNGWVERASEIRPPLTVAPAAEHLALSWHQAARLGAAELRAWCPKHLEKARATAEREAKRAAAAVAADEQMDLMGETA